MKRLLLFLSLCLSQPAFSQLPEFYRNVDRIVWVVKSLDPVIQGWGKLGFPVREVGEVEYSSIQFRGRSTSGKARVALSSLAGAQVVWIQPLAGVNAYTEFLQEHGDGVFSLVHRVPSADALDREVKRLVDQGFSVLQRGAYNSPPGSVDYAFLDTLKRGKYSLGLVHDPTGFDLKSPERTGVAALPLKMDQYAFVARDLRTVSSYWNRAGFPELSYTHPALSELKYRGEPGSFDQELGWQRHGAVVYEWIKPLKGPTVYEDALRSHGEGFHHLAFQVEDLDKAMVAWTAAGFPVIQSGAWGERGTSGSGRFAYVDTDSIGGVIVELLWSFK